MSIPTKEHPVLRIADERTVRVGDNVTAVGFPESDGIARLTGSSAIWPVMREMEATSTFGRISARNRQVGKNDCFQVDMTINHGNSGGPTLDSEGRVVAISTFGLGEGDRINFVIKMTAVMHFINEHCDFPIEVEK